MKKIIQKKSTQNNEHSDYVLCRPRYSGDPGSGFIRLDSRHTVAVHLFDFLFRFTHKNSEKLFHSGTHQNFNLRRNNRRAFTVLFAVIVSSLILALGLGIVAITMKEVRLSGTGRDSQFAFYAADSGSECALYYDTRGEEYFATSSYSLPNAEIICNGQKIVATTTAPTAEAATSTFRMYMKYNSPVEVVTEPCVDVYVIKGKHPITGSTTTSIDSRGYNTCVESNPRRIERGYRVQY